MEPDLRGVVYGKESEDADGAAFMTVQQSLPAPKSRMAQFVVVAKALSCGALSFAALFLVLVCYVFDVYDDWAGVVDPDAPGALVAVLSIALMLATGAAAIVGRHVTTWVVYTLFMIVWAIRLSQILPYC